MKIVEYKFITSYVIDQDNEDMVEIVKKQIQTDASDNRMKYFLEITEIEDGTEAHIDEIISDQM